MNASADSSHRDDAHSVNGHDANGVPAANAFSTRRIRPGQLAYRFADDSRLETLAQRLEDQGGWGEIVGPHGSGKSTLLEDLLPRCEARGRMVDRFQFRSDQRRLAISKERRKSWNAHTLVVVDGYEQLSWWNRWRLKRWCRQRGAGLLVTAHAAQGLPRLHTTTTSVDLLRTLVRELVADSPPAWHPSDNEVSAAFHLHEGNLREALLRLYDVFQQRQLSGPPRDTSSSPLG